MAFTSRATALQNLAKGQGYFHAGVNSVGGSGTTTAAAASGFFSCQLGANSIGSTFPGTLQSLPTPTSPPNALLQAFFHSAGNAARGGWLARFYKLGTLNLAATGDQFTHDSATFPVTRTQLGAATQPLTLVPVLFITTATTTTAAAFVLKAGAGTAGYTNQDGTGVVGTKTFTLPAAATAVNSAFILRLEDGDSGVRDFTQVNVTTAASAGAATLYGAELLQPFMSPLASEGSVADSMFGGLSMNEVMPAAATSGTLTSFLGLFGTNSVTGTNPPSPVLFSVLDA